MTNVPVKQSVTKAGARRVRPRRDFAAMEERRMRGADLFEQGVRPAEIARQLDVCVIRLCRIGAARGGGPVETDCARPDGPDDCRS